MTRPELGFLHSQVDVCASGEMRPQYFGLVTNNYNDRYWRHCVCGPENVVDERSTASAVQNLGDRGLHARPLTGGEHYDVEVWTSGFGRHGPPDVSGEP